MIELDLDTSTVIIDGRRWPAVALICPPWEGDTDPEYERALGTGTVGTMSDSWDVYVPLENGLVANLSVMPSRNRIDMHMEVTWCYEHKSDGDGPLWLPLAVASLNADTLVTTTGWRTLSWHDADPEWINETLDRYSSKQINQPLPNPPRAKMVGLNYALHMHTQLLSERARQ